jgi:hypothetical protein
VSLPLRNDPPPLPKRSSPGCGRPRRGAIRARPGPSDRACRADPGAPLTPRAPALLIREQRGRPLCRLRSRRLGGRRGAPLSLAAAADSSDKRACIARVSAIACRCCSVTRSLLRRFRRGWRGPLGGCGGEHIGYPRHLSKSFIRDISQGAVCLRRAPPAPSAFQWTEFDCWKVLAKL